MRHPDNNADLSHNKFRELLSHMAPEKRADAIRRRNVETSRRQQMERDANKLLKLAAHKQRGMFPSEPRMEAALAGRPLPGVKCCGAECRGHAPWPTHYMIPTSAGDVSYECWLHSQSEGFLRALPPSSSIIRFG